MKQRRRLLGVVTVAVFATLIGRMWYLQVVASESYDDVAAGNRTRIVQTEAPRGRILDLHGRPMADTRVSLTVVLDHAEVSTLEEDERSSLFEELAAELTLGGHALSDEDVAERYEEAVGSALQPVVLATDIEPELWIVLGERSFSGVSVEARSVRFYPLGTVAGHLVGHLGTVADDEEVDALNELASMETKPYLPGDVIGRDGIEQAFEAQLRGTPEIKLVEIDASNRVLRTVEILQPAAAGSDVHLTIDLDLQRLAETAVERELAAAQTRSNEAAESNCSDCDLLDAPAGSLVALRPDDGSVVALASIPSYDPSWFLDGLSQQQADALFQDPHRPLVNRAIAGQYPAGSTFKPITAYAAMLSGVRQPDEIWIDRGQHTLTGCRSGDDGGCVFRNAGSVVMGAVDLPAALGRSSDTYFYSLGERFWNERQLYGDTPIQDTAQRFGFGTETGVELPGEEDGVVPTPAWRQASGGQWFTGDNVNLAIGQGDLLVTPLQLVNAYAALATGGTRYRPRLVASVTNGTTGSVEESFLPFAVANVPLDAGALGPIRDGLLSAPTTGTAAAAFADFPLNAYPIGGKTGTTQVTGRGDFSLFVGYGPWPASEYAVAVVLEEAGFGGQAAAPAASSFLAAALQVDPTNQPSEPPVLQP